MKLPTDISSVTLNEGSRGPYPPNGFVPIAEGAIGNGDFYGLYWPFGLEDREPMICDMAHDAWRMEPGFSSLGKFMSWLDLNGGEWGEEPVPDPDFGVEKFQKAKECLKQNSFPEAIALLHEACDSLAEVGEYWTLLANLCFREGDTDVAANAAIRAYCSNWTFGMPTAQSLNLLTRSAKGVAKNPHPLLTKVGQFDLSFGGQKENANYGIMQQCIEECLMSEEPILGLLLHQNYAFMMQMETTSFHERYGFDIVQWQDKHAGHCQEHLGNDRQFSA